MESNAIQSLGSYVDDIKSIIHVARNKTYSAVNAAMCEAYWLIGKRIVEEEQQGKHRADYGKEIIKKLSQALRQEFGSGFGERNLRNFRQFYLIFQDDEIWHTPCAKLTDGNEILHTPCAELPKDSEIWHAVRAKLTWSHFRSLMRVSDKEARQYYMTEAAEQHWTVKTLDRNISTLYYQRLLSSQKKDLVVAEMQEKTAALQDVKFDFIKNPAVLEFLGLPNNGTYLEEELDKAIIDHLQQFLLELGKGFAFVSRVLNLHHQHSRIVAVATFRSICRCLCLVSFLAFV